MDEKIKKLWENNKIVFFILLPIILLVFFKDLVIELLIGSARRMSREAEKKDADLKSQQDAASIEADRLRKEADALGKKAENPNVDEDWHKRN